MIEFSDGTHTYVTERRAAVPAKLAKAIATMFPGRRFTVVSPYYLEIYPDGTYSTQKGGEPEAQRTPAPENPQSTAKPVKTGRPSAANQQPQVRETGFKAMWAAPNAEPVAVSIVQLGTHTSVVLLNGEEKEIPSAELRFGEKTTANRAVAVIHAPNTGKCSLRKTASEKGKLLKNCKAGVVVGVVEYGGKFTKIIYKETEGYVLTSCLKFYGEEHAPIGTGVLTLNGRATGRTTINVRNAAKAGSFVIAEWLTGTEVTIFSHKNGWYEIEYDGLHGFVMERYLTVNE